MRDWEKINLDEIGEPYISYFIEEYGLVSMIRIERIYLISDDNVDAEIKAYVKDNNDDNVFNVVRNYELDTLFDREYYQLKEQYRRHYGYGSNRVIKDYVTPLKDFKYLIRLTGYNGSRLEFYKDIIVSNEKEFLEYEILASKNQKRYKKPILADIEKGQKLFYIGKGLCKIVSVFDYPKDLPKICKVQFENYDEIIIEQGDKKFVYIPYDSPDGPLKQFNESLNELQLQPMIIWDNKSNLLSAMWQPIEDASRYIIKVFQYQDNENNMKKLYFLKNYEIDRNVHFITINDYIINSYMIFVITAENREGNVVAQSRGIKISSSKNYPQWFDNYEL